MVAISITQILSKLGIITCRYVFYKSYAKLARLIPVLKGKGVRAPPSSVLSPATEGQELIIEKFSCTLSCSLSLFRVKSEECRTVV